jgi:hypothetical protein
MASFKTIYTMQEQAGRDYWGVGLGVPVDGKFRRSKQMENIVFKIKKLHGDIFVF